MVVINTARFGHAAPICSCSGCVVKCTFQSGACAGRGVPPGIGAGVYSSSPWETSFLALTEDAGWKSPYGQFFLKWYSEKLIKCAKASGQGVLDVKTSGLMVTSHDTSIAVKARVPTMSRIYGMR